MASIRRKVYGLGLLILAKFTGGKKELQIMKNLEISRRKFMGLTLAGGGALATTGSSLFNLTPETAKESSSADYAMIIDTTKCVGCGACVTACTMVNDLPENKSYVQRIVKVDEGKTWFLMMSCQHCANPPCATVCPTNATYIRPDGVVMTDRKLCVGCKYCMYACPYEARVYLREEGVADKCWLCMNRVLQGKDPGCVFACLFGARIFGKTDDPEVSKVLASGKAKPLYPEFGTNPAIVTYIIES